eukprot:9065727-Karenia_brevis.AAC.1
MQHPMPTWRSSRGPIAVTRLCLQRIGWQWDSPFSFVTDQGDQVDLTKFSPPLIESLLFDAWHRRLEGVAARKLNHADFDGRRVFMGHVAQFKNSKAAKQDPWGTACVLGCCVGSTWTKRRAYDAGYEVDVTCDLCGQADDDLYHRIWECPATEAIRGQEAPDWLRRAAADAPRHSLLYTRGVLPHPGDKVTARPAVQDGFEVRFEHSQGWALDDTTVGGDLFVDGSCKPHVVPELARAAAAVVAIDADSQLLFRFLMPVCRPWPQTPQAAEYIAGALPYRVATTETVVYSDCANVVKDHNDAHSGFHHKRAYAGLMRDRLQLPSSAQHIRAFRKVRAHQSLADITDAAERRLAAGNNLADEAAKEALEICHPPVNESERRAVNREVRIAHAVLQLIACLGKEWRRVPRATRRQPARRQQVEALPLQCNANPPPAASALHVTHQLWVTGQ